MYDNLELFSDIHLKYCLFTLPLLDSIIINITVAIFMQSVTLLLRATDNICHQKDIFVDLRIDYCDWSIVIIYTNALCVDFFYYFFQHSDVLISGVRLTERFPFCWPFMSNPLVSAEFLHK